MHAPGFDTWRTPAVAHSCSRCTVQRTCSCARVSAVHVAAYGVMRCTVVQRNAGPAFSPALPFISAPRSASPLSHSLAHPLPCPITFSKETPRKTAGRRRWRRKPRPPTPCSPPSRHRRPHHYRRLGPRRPVRVRRAGEPLRHQHRRRRRGN